MKHKPKNSAFGVAALHSLCERTLARPAPKIPSYGSFRGSEVEFRSVETSVGFAGAKQAPKVYTGDKIVGISTTHKSNIVPVFSKEHAVEISSMRR